MKHLWTPWRMPWIRSDKRALERETRCVFCRLAASEDELIVARSSHVYVMLNANPYNFAHLMVIPLAHGPDMEALPDAALLDLMQTCNRAMACLRRLYQPAAFNMGANIGRRGRRQHPLPLSHARRAALARRNRLHHHHRRHARHPGHAGEHRPRTQGDLA